MSQVFEMIPAGSRPVWIFGTITGVLLALSLLFGFFTFSSRRVRFEVTDVGLRLVGDLYGRTIPFDRMQLDDARPADLSTESDLKPRWRTFGSALPGYRAGWFRLRNGRRALMYVTDVTRVAALPTRDDYVLLLSVDDPAAFLDTLRARATRGDG